MDKPENNTATMRAQRGFTLVELVVVIAILGVIAAIAMPTVSAYLSSSKVQAYNADHARIQQAVDAFYSDPANHRFLGRRQFPIHGAAKATGSFYKGDADNAPQTVAITGNPLGGIVGGDPTWVDDGDGIRKDPEELLNDEDSPPTAPGWHVAQVLRQESTYFVDSRDYFINFELLVEKGLLDKVPASASPDNRPPGSTTVYEGSYSWFVDNHGRINSLLRFFPKSDQTGFREAFP